jgi:autotransporter-associated beta strand protein
MWRRRPACGRSRDRSRDGCATDWPEISKFRQIFFTGVSDFVGGFRFLLCRDLAERGLAPHQLHPPSMKNRRYKFLLPPANRRQTSAAIAGLLSAMGVISSANAATQTWSGTASGVWDTSALNWDSGTATWTNTNNALFSGTPTNNVTTATGLTIGTITLDNTFTGSVTMSGSNTVSGATTISAGTLNLNNATGLGTSAITVNSGGTLAINPGTANNTVSNNISGAGLVTVQDPAGAGGNTLQLGGNYSGFTGTLNILAGASNFGKVNFSDVAQANVISSSATIQIQSGATLYLNKTLNYGASIQLFGASNSENLGALRLETSANVTGSVTLKADSFIGVNATAASISGVIGENGGSFGFTKVGNSTLWLTGANTYTGTTTVSSGTLQVGIGGATGSLGSGAVTNNATLAFNRSDSITVGSTIGGTGALSKLGSGTLTLTGTNTYTGTTTIGASGIQGGTLNVGNGTSGSLGGTGALTFSNTGTVNFNEAAGSSQGMGALTFSAGAGTVQSTYGGSGTSTLTFASLAARAAGATGNFVSSGGVNGTSNIIKFTSAPTAGTLIDKGEFYNGSSYASYDSGGFVRAYTTSDTNAVSSGAGTSTIANTSTNNVFLTGADTAQTTATVNTINMGSTGTIALAAANTLSTSGILVSGNTAASISGGTSLSSATAGAELVVRTDLSTDNLDISTPIVNNTSASALTKTGAGTLTLSGTGNAYTGATTVDEGTLSLSGTLTGGGAITIQPGATFSETSAGVISGASTLTTSGTTTLAGANTYTGTTTVNGGTLNYTGTGTNFGQLTVNNSGANSVVNFASGAGAYTYTNKNFLVGNSEPVLESASVPLLTVVAPV